MALNPFRHGSIVALLVAAAAASQVAATFAASPGFSGRAGGVTCVACHTVAPLLHEEAEAVLDGLPAAWLPGERYALTVRVAGGPPALPAPQPQGGFDLAVGAGRLEVPAGMERAVRLVGPHEATYLPEGTLMREWRLDWVAPGLEARPAPVPLWLAVVAANGNHVIATNTSDGGERFDASAALQASIPPDPSALEAWRALPLVGPEASARRDGDGWRVDGRHLDGNATRLLWRLDAGPWQARDTGTDWRLRLPRLGAGDHVLLLRSDGGERGSADIALTLHEPGLLDPVRGAGRAVPAPAWPTVASLALAFLATHARRSA